MEIKNVEAFYMNLSFSSSANYPLPSFSNLSTSHQLLSDLIGNIVCVLLMPLFVALVSSDQLFSSLQVVASGDSPAQFHFVIVILTVKSSTSVLILVSSFRLRYVMLSLSLLRSIARYILYLMCLH